jgi:triosephosphate isomerase
MIFVNFKTFEQGTGERALKLAEICQAVAKEASVKIIAVVQAADIFRVASKVKIPIWVQHVDEIEFGANTGKILPEVVKAAGAAGTLLSHSENKLPVEVVGESVGRCQEVGLKTLVCAETVGEAREVAFFKPDFLAYEPPELIGTNVSVSAAKPTVVKDFVKAKLGAPLVIGAGVHSQADIRKGLKLGAKGFLVASDVVLGKNPKAELLDLAKGFKQ